MRDKEKDRYLTLRYGKSFSRHLVFLCPRCEMLWTPGECRKCGRIGNYVLACSWPRMWKGILR